MVVVGGVVGGDINDWSPLLGPSENLIYIEIVFCLACFLEISIV